MKLFKGNSKKPIEAEVDSTAEGLWRLYQAGRERLFQKNIYQETARCYDFYEGNQWKDFAGGEDMPRMNFIKPVGRHKISSVAQNQVAITFSALDTENREKQRLCSALNRLATRQWEGADMDSLCWSILKNAFIAGEDYLFCTAVKDPSYGGLGWRAELNIRRIAKTDVYLADEQNPNLQEQEYIIIASRLPINRVIEMAEQNGVAPDELNKITPDNEGINSSSSMNSINSINSSGGAEMGDNKCTVLLYLKKTKTGVSFYKGTKSVIIQKRQEIKGLSLYPIASMRWEEREGDARGISGVKYLIANQLEVNKTAARRAIAVRRFSFPTLAYDKSAITNIDDLEKVGASVAIDNVRENPIDRIIQYLNPAPISGDAQVLQTELMQYSRELEGASEAATGQVDPTRASGEAIKAARDQAAIPLNEQLSSYRRFLEETARIWLSLWIAYAENGLAIDSDPEFANQRLIISREELVKNRPEIKVDISPIDPYSRLSGEIALERLLSHGHITFPEYVKALDDTSGVPKAKLMKILSERE